MQEEWMMHAGQQPRKVSFKNGKKYELQNEMEKSDIELQELGGSEKKLLESEESKMVRVEGTERKLIGSGQSNRELQKTERENQGIVDIGDIEIGLGNVPKRKGSWGAPLGGRRPSNNEKNKSN